MNSDQPPRVSSKRSPLTRRLLIAMVLTALLMVTALLLGRGLTGASGRLACLPGILVVHYLLPLLKGPYHSLSILLLGVSLPLRGGDFTIGIVALSALFWVAGIAWLLKGGLVQRLAVATFLGWIGLSILFMWNPVCVYQGPSANACINNLRQIEGAKQQWALANHKTRDETPTWDDLTGYLRDGVSESNACPSGGEYTIGKVGVPTTCSIKGRVRGRKQRVGWFGYRWEIEPAGSGGHFIQ